MPTRIPIDVDSAVTTIIVQRPYKQHISAYEHWLKQIVPKAQQFPGHRGVNIIRPHGQQQDYTIVLHFDTESHLRAWLDSDVRKSLIEEVRPWLDTDETIEIKTGLEFWFTPPDSRKAARPYKQFLVTLSAIFPLSLLVQALLAPVWASFTFSVPLAVKAFLSSFIIVGLMTFVIMPRYVRLVASWLYR